MKRVMWAAVVCVAVAAVAQPPSRAAARFGEPRRSESGGGGFSPAADPTVTKAQVDQWMTELSNWGRWGKMDQIGTLNLITPDTRRQALKLARDGVSVSLAHTIDKQKADDNPRPLWQEMVHHGSIIVALGLPLIDVMDLEAAAEMAARLRRCEFLLIAAAVPVLGGTGFPLNPIATF